MAKFQKLLDRLEALPPAERAEWERRFAQVSNTVTQGLAASMAKSRKALDLPDDAGWLRIWARAYARQIPDEDFWEMSPDELVAVMKERSIDRAEMAAMTAERQTVVDELQNCPGARLRQARLERNETQGEAAEELHRLSKRRWKPTAMVVSEIERLRRNPHPENRRYIEQYVQTAKKQIKNR